MDSKPRKKDDSDKQIPFQRLNFGQNKHGAMRCDSLARAKEFGITSLQSIACLYKVSAKDSGLRFAAV